MKKYKNIGQVLLLAFSFFLLFTAYFTCSSFQTKVYRDDGFENLGFSLAAVGYGVFCAMSLFGGALVKKINRPGRTMGIAALGYSFWIFSFLLPTYYSQMEDKTNLPWYLNKSIILFVIYLSSVIAGLGAGFLWVSQGTFIAACSSEENKGLYTSIFWYFQISQIIGYIIASKVLHSGANISNMFILFGIMAIVGALSMCLLKLPEEDDFSETSDQLEGGLEEIRGSSETNPLNSVDQGRKSELDNSEITIGDDIKATFYLMLSSRMRQVLLFVLWGAISIVISGSLFIPLMTRTMSNSPEYPDLYKDQSNQNQAALMAMAWLGLGEIIGAPVMGNIRDRIGNKAALIFLGIAEVIAFGCLLSFNNSNKWSNLGYAMCFTWGFQDGCTNTLVICIFGFEFGDSALSFSVFNFFQNLCVFAFQLIAGAVDNPNDDAEQNKTAIFKFVVAVGVVCAVSIAVLFSFKFRQDQKSSAEQRKGILDEFAIE